MSAVRHRPWGTIPGPRPLLGPFSAAFAFFNDPIGYLDNLFPRFGHLVWVKNPPMATPPNPTYPGTVFLYGPELIQQVVMQHDAYYRVPMSLSLYPAGVVTSRQEPLTRIMTGLPSLRKDEHRKHRRLMMPAFHKQAVQSYHEDMVTATLEMLDRWRVGQQLDVSQEMLRLTMRITALTLFGRENVAEGERVGNTVALRHAFLGDCCTDRFRYFSAMSRINLHYAAR